MKRIKKLIDFSRSAKDKKANKFQSPARKDTVSVERIKKLMSFCLRGKDKKKLISFHPNIFFPG